MVDFPGTVSHNDVEKVAVLLGFVWRATTGDHKQYKKEGARGFPIPTYKEITVNGHLFKSMIRSMGITKTMFFRLLAEA